MKRTSYVMKVQERSSCMLCAAMLITRVAAFQLHPSPRRYIHHLLQTSKNDGDGALQDDGLEQPKKTLTFSQFDTDSDGKISLSDLRTGLEKELKVHVMYVCTYLVLFSEFRYYVSYLH